MGLCDGAVLPVRSCEWVDVGGREGGREALSEPTACSLDFFKPLRMVCNFENGPKSFEAKIMNEAGQQILFRENKNK